MLLIGSGLMIRGLWNLQQVDIGLNTRNLLTMRIALPDAVYTSDPQAAQFWDALHDRVSALPGVDSAGLSDGLPPQRPINANDTEIANFVRTPNGPIENVDYWSFVGPDYLLVAAWIFFG